jgi:hypothetical protein
MFRILVIQYCFGFRGYPYGMLRAGFEFVLINLRQSHFFEPGPEDQVFNE